MFSGSIVVLITPFLEDFSIDYETFKSLVLRQKKAQSDAIIIGGTTGESSTLSQEEIEKLFFLAKEIIGNDLLILLGTGTNNTCSTVIHTQRAKQIGADGALVILPYYNKPQDRGCFLHFEQLSKLNFPIIVYHHPGRCAQKTSLDTLKAIMNLPNMVGIKECSGDLNYIRELKKYHLLCGCDEHTMEMLLMGAKGSVNVLGNAFPKVWKTFVSSQDKQLFSQLLPLIEAINLETNPTGIKAAMHALGLCKHILRLPLVSCKQDRFSQIQHAVEVFALSSV